ncbi:hypothetical protein NX059_007027 [Plenodomus lindquistii]|nr:hypothetical protein NX059_007027 [Plenodomus lindquistii]
MTSRSSNLIPHLVPNLPPDFYYMPNFITRAEELSLLQKIPAQRWTHLTHRRLQAHPSILTKNNALLAAPLPSYLTNPVVERFREMGIFAGTPHGSPNHVLINEYKPGEGIMPHEDGDAYAGVVATVSLGGALCLDIVSKPTRTEGFGDDAGQTVDDEESQEEQKQDYTIPTRILQEPRSLLITTGPAYRDYMHGIAAIEVDEELGPGTVANWNMLGDRTVFEQQGGKNVREIRTSLTYRDVLKVSSAANRVFGGLERR